MESAFADADKHGSCFLLIDAAKASSNPDIAHPKHALAIQEVPLNAWLDVMCRNGTNSSSIKGSMLDPQSEATYQRMWAHPHCSLEDLMKIMEPKIEQQRDYDDQAEASCMAAESESPARTRAGQRRLVPTSSQAY